MLHRHSAGVCFALVVFLTSATSLVAQTGSSRRDPAPPNSDRPTTEGQYFSDDVGLRLSVDASPQEGFVDASTYRLGRMDMLSIEIDGIAPVNFRGLTVNADGDLIIPTVGVLRVRDMIFADAIVQISDLVRTKYVTKNVHVSLERLKPVHVHITGDIGSAQSLIIPANTRLSKVITPIVQTAATMEVLTRQIEIRGRDGSVNLADLEAFRLGGVLEDNPFIQDGDVIVLTKRTWFEPRVSMTGAVARPLLFDYRNDDNLTKLLNIAGGYRFDADTTHFFIHRIENGQTVQVRIERSVYQSENIALRPNDRIIIPALPDTYLMQAASIIGEIRIPGTYPIIRSSTTLRDLLESGGGLKSTALRQGIIVERRIPRIQPAQASLFARTSDQYTEGFQYLETERMLSSFIFLDLRNEESYDFVINDQDVVTIPKDETTVYVFGQVNRTGYYLHTPGQSVKRYLDAAGGFGLAAEPSRIFVIKSGSYIWLQPEQTTVESGDMIFVDRKPYEDVQTARQYDLQLRNQRNSNMSLVLTTVTTLATLVSTIYIVTR